MEEIYENSILIAIALVLVFTSISSAAEKQNAENLIIKEMMALIKPLKQQLMLLY